jgi:hypothetical protein
MSVTTPFKEIVAVELLEELVSAILPQDGGEAKS